MLIKLSRKIAYIFIMNGAEKEDLEIYAYGLQILLSTAFTLMMSYLTALLFGVVPELTCYLITFIIIRRCAGGYHAKHFCTCCIMTVSSSISGIYAAKWIFRQEILWMVVLYLAAMGIFVWLAPVVNKNKQLTNEEIPKYRKITLGVGAAAGAFSALLSITGNGYWASLIVMGLAVTAVLMIVGWQEVRKELFQTESWTGKAQKE